MFDIITKEDYSTWLESGQATPVEMTPGAWGMLLRLCSAAPLPRLQRFARRQALLHKLTHDFQLKDIQDAFVLSQIGAARGQTILEIGGGDSRIMRYLARHNTCWLADKFEGSGRGPVRPPRLPGVQIVREYVGSFSPLLPDGAFDTLFSVSVLEHVALDQLENFFRDCARLLKPGGRMIHAIDIYLFDQSPLTDAYAEPFRERLRAYLSFANRPDLGLRLMQPAAVTEPVAFSCGYASNPDNVIMMWNLARPHAKRLAGQVVSIKAIWQRGS